MRFCLKRRLKSESEDPLLRNNLRDEHMCRGSADAALPEPRPTCIAASMLEIKQTVCQLVSTDPASGPGPYNKLGHTGVKDSIGCRQHVINMAPNRTLPVGTRYYNQQMFGESLVDFAKTRLFDDGTEAEFMAARQGQVGAISKPLGSWLRYAGLGREREATTHYTTNNLALEMDTGGWASDNALSNRFAAIFGVRNTAQSYVLLGVIWGIPCRLRVCIWEELSSFLCVPHRASSTRSPSKNDWRRRGPMLLPFELLRLRSGAANL